MREEKKKKRKKENKSKKKAYCKQEITSFGSVIELTKALTGSKMEPSAPGFFSP